MEKYAESQGFKLNPDEKVVTALLQGLIKNEEKYGQRYCPCRPVTGDQEEDKLKVCPCIWHRTEIENMGHCHCGLFVRG
jgi:ferredoxin-thioredoxin reductase catalytic subunit